MAKQLRISPATSGSNQRSRLRRRAKLPEDLHVARVRRLSIERVMPQRATPELFAHKGIFDAIEPEPTAIAAEREAPTGPSA